jgi:hypothetical protein
MPKFDVTAPDGQKFEVNAPDGATESDAISYVQKQFYGPKQVAMPAPEKSTGEKINDAVGSTSLGEIGRQLGLTARYGLQGAGDVLDTLSSPIRAGLNMMGANIQGRSGETAADALGLPKPQGDLENTIGKASELMAGGAIPIGLASKAAQGTQGVTQAVLKQVAANPIAQTVSNAGAGAAGEYVKQEGGNEKAQLLATLGGGLLAPAALAGGQKAVNAVKSMTSRPAQQQAIDLTIKNIIDNGDYGVQFADVGGNVKAQLRKDIAEAQKGGGLLDQNAMRRLVDYRIAGATPTKGSLTLDPIQITRERNLAKIGANSDDVTLHSLANMQNSNNRTLIDNLNDLGAGTAATQYDAGGRILQALDNTDQAARSAISDAYNRARDSAGRSANLDPSAFSQRAGDLLNQANAESFLPGGIRKTMNRIAKGEMPLNVEIAEQLKTNIGRIQRGSTDGNTRHALGLVRQALDETPLINNRPQAPVANPNAGTGLMSRGQGDLNAAQAPQQGQSLGQDAIDAFNQARKLYATRQGKIKSTPALKALIDGAEPDKFVQNFIVGQGGKANVADLQALRAAVENDPGALQTIRDQISAHLKSSALGGHADEVGNFSESNFNKALSQIGDQKLKMFFTPEEVAQLKSVGRVASYEQYQPRGSAVNNSNSGALALAGALDFIANNKILSRIPMADSVLRTPARNWSTQIQMKQVTDVPRGLLVTQPAGQRPVPYGLLTAPAILNTTNQQ